MNREHNRSKMLQQKGNNKSISINVRTEKKHVEIHGSQTLVTSLYPSWSPSKTRKCDRNCVNHFYATVRVWKSYSLSDCVTRSLITLYQVVMYIFTDYYDTNWCRKSSSSFEKQTNSLLSECILNVNERQETATTKTNCHMQLRFRKHF